MRFGGIRRNACTQSTRLITRRSQVQILPPLLPEAPATAPSASLVPDRADFLGRARAHSANAVRRAPVCVADDHSPPLGESCSLGWMFRWVLLAVVLLGTTLPLASAAARQQPLAGDDGSRLVPPGDGQAYIGLTFPLFDTSEPVWGDDRPVALR